MAWALLSSKANRLGPHQIVEELRDPVVIHLVMMNSPAWKNRAKHILSVTSWGVTFAMAFRPTTRPWMTAMGYGSDPIVCVCMCMCSFVYVCDKYASSRNGETIPTAE